MILYIYNPCFKIIFDNIPNVQLSDFTESNAYKIIIHICFN
jgi:hypothetical protein